MNIEFKILVSDSSETFVSAAELISNIDKYAEYLAPAKQVHYARIRISKKGQPTISFFDELANFCMQFCFLKLKTLLEEKHVTFRVMMTGDPMELTEIDGQIKVRFEETESVFDTDEFISSAYACGLKYLDFLDVLSSEGHKANKRVIEENLEPVTLFLKARGLIA